MGTDLIKACIAGNTDAVRELLQGGADVEIRGMVMGSVKCLLENLCIFRL